MHKVRGLHMPYEIGFVLTHGAESSQKAAAPLIAIPREPQGLQAFRLSGITHYNQYAFRNRDGGA